jgi:hypothetical protein
MKQFIACVILVISGCSGDPMVAPSSLETSWIDAATHSDTIITNINNQPTIIYYAAQNWQTAADTSIAHGYRFIGARKGDTILVKPLDDSTTNYQTYISGNNENSDTLKSQNFLDTLAINPVRTFVHLK